MSLSTIPGLAPALDEVGAVAGLLWHMGWAEASAGNLTLDVSDNVHWKPTSAPRWQEVVPPVQELAARTLLITASGRRLRDCAHEPESCCCLLHLDDAGERVARLETGTDLHPSSELATHLQVHRQLREHFPDHRAVLHAHATHIAALTHLTAFAEPHDLNAALWAIHPELKVFLPRGVALVPYLRPGSAALGEASAAAVAAGHEVVVWKYHGCVAHGRGAHEAFDLVHMVDKAARMILLCAATGMPRKGLERKDLEELREAFSLPEAPN